MGIALSAALYSLLLFTAMIACVEAGRRFGRARAKHEPDDAWTGISVVDGAVFGLLGLLVAFTFSGAASRFDARRALIIEESNAIGTAWLRLDLLPPAAQPALRESFRRYVDTRIETYRDFPDVTAARAEISAGAALQNEIWKQAVPAAAGTQPATMLLIPALNQMFDIASTRTLNIQMHPPPAIYVMLFAMALICAGIAGYGMGKGKSRHWLHTIGFAALTALAFYVIIDLEHPRAGFIRIHGLDQALIDLRKSMN